MNQIEQAFEQTPEEEGDPDRGKERDTITPLEISVWRWTITISRTRLRSY